MTTGMNFWDSQVWNFIITMTLLLGTMIVANILRNTIKIIRRLMIPSSVLGGFLLLFADFLLESLPVLKY
jgi:Na+/glutamate symporter